MINVTDINDKIYAAAREAGDAARTRSRSEMTRAYVEDTDRLGLGRPDDEPLASETIAEIVGLIEALIEGGHAYESGGDVYFRVRSFPGYGKLSNRDPEEMDQGEEAGTESLKEDPLDFALWKARKPDEDTAWPSPWGEGRPGWHIECSAMAEKLLGDDFEIHGGGIDLVFPHHENEIAQTEAGRGVPLARHLDAQRDGPDGGGEDVEVGRKHLPALRGARPIRARRRGRLSDLGPLPAAARVLGAGARGGRRASRADPQLRARAARGRRRAAEDEFVAARREALLDALADDFNTPRALAALFELIAEGNRRRSPGARAALDEMLPLLGLESLLAAGRGDRSGGGAADGGARGRRGRRATSSGPTGSATSSPPVATRSATRAEGPRLVRRAACR